VRTVAEGLRVAIVDTSPLYQGLSDLRTVSYRLSYSNTLVPGSKSKSITTHPPKGEQRRVNEAR
jgi:hypothetical protein